MSYLLDTNIFLEILLSQKKSNDCMNFLQENSNEIYFTDFTLNSIYLKLLHLKKVDVCKSFSKEMQSFKIVNIDQNSYIKIIDCIEKYKLDFDDSYQYVAAKSKNLTIVTMDNDFKKVQKNIEVKFL